MREALVEPVLDLDLDRVLVRHDDRFIEVLEKPMSWDDLVWSCVFALGVLGVAGMATTPFSISTVLIGPFVLLFAALGGYALLQRLRRSAMRIDRETWKVDGACSKRSFDGPPTALASTSLYFAGGPPKRHWGVTLSRATRAW